MKRIVVILMAVYLAFLLEIALFNNFGSWGKPELLNLIVVFFTLYLGIRYGIVAAIAAGLLRDGISVMPVGTYILVYLSVAYIISYARHYLYQPGSRFARVVMAFFGVAIAFVMHAVLASMHVEYQWAETITDVFIPQLITTVIIATFLFSRLKQLSETLRLK